MILQTRQDVIFGGQGMWYTDLVSQRHWPHMFCTEVSSCLPSRRHPLSHQKSITNPGATSSKSCTSNQTPSSTFSPPASLISFLSLATSVALATASLTNKFKYLAVNALASLPIFMLLSSKLSCNKRVISAEGSSGMSSFLPPIAVAGCCAGGGAAAGRAAEERGDKEGRRGGGAVFWRLAGGSVVAGRALRVGAAEKSSLSSSSSSSEMIKASRSSWS